MTAITNKSPTTLTPGDFPRPVDQSTLEITDEDIATRIRAICTATEEDIDAALADTNLNSMQEAYLNAFNENPSRTLREDQVEAIAAKWARTPSAVQRSDINKTGPLPKNSLAIEAIKAQKGVTVVAWILVNTRISLSEEKEISENTLSLHEGAKSIRSDLTKQEAAVFDCLANQYLGIPMNHLGNL